MGNVTNVSRVILAIAIIAAIVLGRRNMYQKSVKNAWN